MEGVAARKWGVAVPKGFQADRTHGRIGEVSGAHWRQGMTKSGEKCIRGILRRVAHKGKESRDIPAREGTVRTRGWMPRESQESAKLSRGAGPRAPALVLCPKQGSESAYRRQGWADVLKDR